MRLIEFRALIIGTKELIIGSLLDWKDGDFSIVVGEKEETGEKNMWRVEPESIGQFTGLLDKNMVKIFEGDILKTNSPKCHHKMVVTFEDGSFCLRIFTSKRFKDAVTFRDALSQSFDSPFTTIPEYEVIGNIHDNPELIKL